MFLFKNCLYLHFCYNSYQETTSVPAQMLGIMKQYGFNIKDLIIINTDTIRDTINIVKKINELSIDTIFVSLLFLQEYYSRIILSNIKKIFPNITIIIGGCGCVSYDYWYKDEMWWDILCYGEGEIVFELLSINEDLSKIPNIYWRKENDIIKNQSYYEQNFDKIAFPDYEFQNINEKTTFLTINRGCYNACSFCSMDYYRQKEKQTITQKYTNIKYRKVDDLISYLKYLKTKNCYCVRVRDSIFFVDNEWFNEFYEKYMNEYENCTHILSGISYPSFINENLATMMSNMKIDYTAFEIQSISENYRKKMYNRHYTNDTIYNDCEIFHRHNISIWTSIIIGGPEENLDNIYDNFDFIISMKPSFFHWNTFQPFRNMKLWDYMVENDYIDFNNIMKIGEKPSLDDINQSNCSSLSVLKNQSFTCKDIEKLNDFIIKKLTENGFVLYNSRLYVQPNAVLHNKNRQF